MNKADLRAHFDRYAPERDRFKRKNRYYHETLEALCRERIAPGKRVLELGCGTGDLLAALRPSTGVGIDLSGAMVREARRKHPGLSFLQGDAESLPLATTFDAVVMSDLVGHLSDIQETFRSLHRVAAPGAPVVVTYFNFVWHSVLRAGERLGLKLPEEQQNWLGMADIENLARLADLAVVEKGVRLLLPKRIPLVATAINALAESRLVYWAALVQFFVLTPAPPRPVRRDLSVTVVVPCRNERGNVAAAVERTPAMGRATEIVFVDGDSTDGTVAEIERQIETWRGRKDISLIHQRPRASAPGVEADAAKETAAAVEPPDLMLKLGKGDAVRKGFAAAKGDVLMILDADLTVPPEELPRFYDVVASGLGRFVSGTRLVYPMEDASMKFLNLLGNKGFSWIFTWLLSQRIKDTLCGTKVLLREDYERIAAGRAFFGDFDPFGDFDLLFGATKLGLPIVEVPVRYRARTYGDTKVRVFKHGILLVRMSLIGFLRLKLGWGRQS